jgi:hypothetical protein
VIQAIIVKQRTVEALVEMLDPQEYPPGAPQAVAVYLLLELVAGHHAGNTAAVFAAGMCVDQLFRQTACNRRLHSRCIPQLNACQ